MRQRFVCWPAADRDVSEVRSELRAHTRTLNALRETQAEFGRRLGGVEMRSGVAQIVALLGGAPPA
ncbi:MAG: hypothetical protein BGP03_30945 [Pseudonocardia sp. 73-21]|nr:MAG: hypothetical protein BGP03_30945 [Pseudonocardia sp. 73-21]